MLAHLNVFDSYITMLMNPLQVYSRQLTELLLIVCLHAVYKENSILVSLHASTTHSLID